MQSTWVVIYVSKECFIPQRLPVPSYSGVVMRGVVFPMFMLIFITMNNGTLPADWKRAIVVPIHKGG